MNGPRGSLVIGLLFLIAAEIAWLGGALTGSGSWLGGLLFLCFIAAVIRVFVELFRQGARQRDVEERESVPTRRVSDPPRRRPPHA